MYGRTFPQQYIFGSRAQVSARAGLAGPALATFLLCACAHQALDPPPLGNHLVTVAQPPSASAPNNRIAARAPIPEPTTALPLLPAPSAQAPHEVFSIVVHEVPLRDLLFTLARDAALNLDLVGDLDIPITLNALDQSLPKILDRIALQAPIHYRWRGDQLLVSRDRPYLHNYAVNYLNIARSAISRVDLATRIGSISLSLDGADSGGQGSNNSQTQVLNHSEHHFWDVLIDNIEQLLGGDPSAGDSRRAIVNRETGLLAVRATHRQHAEIQSFLDHVTASARRQALIEATVVEITLDDAYQAGVDWRILAAADSGLDIRQALSGSLPAANATNVPSFLLSYRNPSAGSGDVLATLKLLETFGRVQILSSPKIIALNNQTAVLKVVDNHVYFTLSVTPALTNAEGAITQAATRHTSIHTVPVGFVMNVTPFISSDREVILNVRPSISRILGFVDDPNPDLAAEGVANRIPEIQVREMESLLRVHSGQVAIIGGLMQDQLDTQQRGIPGLASLPWLGSLFSYRQERQVKTELLVFLRPTVIDHAAPDGELQPFYNGWRSSSDSGSREATPKLSATLRLTS